MTDRGSYRHILRVSSIIGSASIVNVLMGLLRMKAAALLLGPSGVGLIGLLNSLMATGSSVFGLGLTNAGTRRVAAAATEGEKELAAARSALFWGTCGAALLAGLTVWLLRHQLATWLLEDQALAAGMGWVALGVALTVGSGSQVALIRGLQRSSDIAKITALSAVLSSVLGVALIYWLGEAGIFLFCVCAPASAFVLGHWYASRVPRTTYRPNPKEVGAEWRSMAVLGISFLVSGLVVTASHFIVRADIAREIGGEALGLFQASWLISTAYIGFLMQTMGNEYFPRIAASMGDASAVNRMANQQTEIGILITGPILVVMVAFAAPALLVLYSQEFKAAATLLCLLIFGDLLKILGMPLRYITMASGRGSVFAITEVVPSILFVLASLALTRRVGLYGVGFAYIGMQATMLAASYAYARWRTGFVWGRATFKFWIFALCTMIAAYACSSTIGGILGNLLAASAVLIISVVNIRVLIDIAGGTDSIPVLGKVLAKMPFGRRR